MRLVIAFACVFGCSSVFAQGGWLVQGATITKVINTYGNEDSFAVKVAGGTTNLCGGGYIQFPVDSTNPDINKRAYSAAMAALGAGWTVEIYSYATTPICSKAAFIGVEK